MKVKQTTAQPGDHPFRSLSLFPSMLSALRFTLRRFARSAGYAATACALVLVFAPMAGDAWNIPIDSDSNEGGAIPDDMINAAQPLG